MRKNHTSSATKSRTLIKRDTRQGQFILGQGAFSKVAAVEGIVLSQALKDDLRRLGGVSAQKRRAALAQKYGK